MKRELCISLALALATAAAFAGVLRNGFVNLDDDLYVYENRVVQMGLSRPSVNWAFTNTEAANWHPLTWLSLQLDYECFGLNAAGYHATSLLFHVANTVLLFWLLRVMTGAVAASAWAAAVFALHPLHVESVAWVAERKDVLSTFFFLLSVLCWQVYARRSAAWGYVLALVSFVLSLMAKPMGVTLPLVLLLLDVWPLKRWPGAAASQSQERRGPTTSFGLVAEKTPFFMIGAAFTAIAVLAQGSKRATEFGEALSFGDRLLMVPVNYTTYLFRTLWPLDLAMLYPHPGAGLPWWKPAGAAFLLVLLTMATWLLRKSFAYLLVGWLWFLIALLPVIGLVQLGSQSTADRYMYLPMIGLLVAVCWGTAEAVARRGRGARRVAALSAAVALLLCAWLSARQVAVWHDGVTAWEHALAVTPPTLVSCNNYGLALEQVGRREEAERWFRRALEIDPAAFKPNCNLGVLLAQQGRLDEAARHFEIALAVNQYDPLLLENLAMVEERRGRLEAALEYYEMAARFDPPVPRIMRRLERARRQLRDPL